MAVIIIDANVIRNIAQGNAALAEALIELMAVPGNRVYIATAAFDEVVKGSAHGHQYRAILDEMGIHTPPPTSMRDRVNVLNRNIHQIPQPAQGVPGPMPEYGGRRDPVTRLKTRPADVFVAAEARALNAELWTQDTQFARQAAQQGVKISPQSNIPSVGGVEDPSVARKLLGFRDGAKVWKPRINIKVRGIAILRGLGVAVIFAIIGGWLEERMINADTKEGLEDLEPQINEAVRNLDQAEVARLQLRLEQGEKVYANVEIRVLITEAGEFLFPQAKWGVNPKYLDTYEKNGFVTVRLADVKIGSKDIRTQKEASYSAPNFGARVITMVESYQIAVYSEDEMEEFRDLSEAYFKAKRHYEMNPSAAKVQQVNKLREEIVNRFGSDVWILA